MYMSRSLPDTTKKQNPYQIVVNNVLWLNGTPYNILWCPCKAAGIPLCWEGGYTSMVTCMLTSLSFCLLSVFSGAVSVRWRDKYDTKSVIRFWSARKRPPNRMNIYMQIAFLSCRKHSRQWSYVQLFARWEQMILEMKMIVMDHDVNVTQLGAWQFCLICGTKCPLTVLFTSLVGWETQIKMVILKCFRNSTL